MSKENRALWIQALTSGEYIQGEGALCRNGKHCCLGVACEVYIRAGNPLEIGQNLEGDVTYSGEGGYLPIEVRDWLGLTDVQGNVFEPDTFLTQLNDEGMSFSEIADLIMGGKVDVTDNQDGGSVEGEQKDTEH